jgi:Flp pilus assembly pilin Flp
MKKMLQALVRLHRCEKGAEGLEKLLIIAAIVLPLLGLLIFYRQTIGDWMSTMWEKIVGDADQDITTPSNTIPGTP